MDQQQRDATTFNETAVITDDQGWIWQMISNHMSRLQLPHVRLPSTVPLRHSWERLCRSPHLILDWEASGRPASAIVEEILSIQPTFDVAGRLIVIVTQPTHEDVLQMAELGITRIVRMRHREQDLAQAGRELTIHLKASHALSPLEERWRKLLRACATLTPTATPESLAFVASELQALSQGDKSARYFDVAAHLHMARGENHDAVAAWYMALDKNPKYHRAYHGLVQFYRQCGRLDEAMAILQKLQAMCRPSTTRLVTIAEIHAERRDFQLAESCFRAALERDAYFSPALNGLAEIRFHEGDLEQTRFLLSKSQTAHRTAAHLNQLGIELVRQGKYQEALEHYTRAQYVLPQQDKSALLYYNIGLCYARWGRPQIACEFLKIALIKEPQYKKAQKLLARLQKALEVAPRVA